MQIEISFFRFSTNQDARTHVGLDEIVLDYDGQLVTTTPDPAVDVNKKFFCSFDKSSCGIKFTGASASLFKIDTSLDVLGYTFTDVTSICEYLFCFSSGF